MKKKYIFISISGLLIIILLSFGYNLIRKKIYEEIHVSVYSNSIIVPVKINGETYNFQLDTGAPTTISDDLFDSLKLQVTDTVHSIDYYGNRKLVKESILPEVKIGKTIFANIKVSVNNPIQNFAPWGIQTDGLLGGNFFKSKVLLIDLKENKLIITNQISQIKLNLKNAVDIKLVGEQNIVELPIHFPSKKAAEIVWFDTGSNNYFYRLKKTIFKEMLKLKTLGKDNIIYELNKKHNGRGSYGTQKDSINYVALFDTIKIGETCLLNCRATTFGTVSYSKSKLGAPLLQTGVVVIDYKNEKFYFTPYENGSIDLKPEIGCYFVYEDDNMYVKYVLPGSIADKHEIKPGYIWKSYNSVILDSLTICEKINLRKLSRINNKNTYVFKDKERVIEIAVNK